MNEWSTNPVFDLRVEEDTGEEVEEYKEDLTLFFSPRRTANPPGGNGGPVVMCLWNLSRV